MAVDKRTEERLFPLFTQEQRGGRKDCYFFKQDIGDKALQQIGGS